MPQTDHDRVIALAGLFQATYLVRAIAHHGQADSRDVEVCLASVLKIDADDSEAVYGGLDNLRSGLRLLNKHLLNPPDMDITRYVVALLVLERKLSRRPALLAQIHAGLLANLEKLNYFPLMHANMIASLAEIYSKTISLLAPRIMVHGEPAYLTDPDNQNRIRALLLAGIRAATLWRQSGGGRLTLLLRRKALLLESQRLLAALGD